MTNNGSNYFYMDKCDQNQLCEKEKLEETQTNPSQQLALYLDHISLRSALDWGNCTLTQTVSFPATALPQPKI